METETASVDKAPLSGPLSKWKDAVAAINDPQTEGRLAGTVFGGSDANPVCDIEAQLTINEEYGHFPDFSSGISNSLAEVKTAWEFRNTLAYWAAIFYIQGSILFLVGSVWLHTGLASNQTNSVGAVTTWVLTPFMVGAFCFTIGNYLTYFQVINKNTRYLNKRFNCMKFVTRPENDLGHWAALLQVIGGGFFNYVTILPFLTTLDTVTEHNLLKIFPGVFGCIIYLVACACYGQYNGWIRLERQTIESVPVWQCWIKFVGLILFLIGYLVDTNRIASLRCLDGNCRLYTYGTWLTFTAGSICFLIVTWLSLVMWKAQNFGLGFAHELAGRRKKIKIDLSQQVFIAVYCIIVTCSFIEIGFWTTQGWTNEYHLNSLLISIQDLIMLHCVLFLMSVIHFTPKRHPYDYLVMAIRLLALFSLGRALLCFKQMAVYF